MDLWKEAQSAAKIIGVLVVLLGAGQAIIVFFGGNVPPWWSASAAAQFQQQIVQHLNTLDVSTALLNRDRIASQLAAVQRSEVKDPDNDGLQAEERRLKFELKLQDKNIETLAAKQQGN